MKSLKLSYNELDPRLKLCFAYCSLFPRGWEFDKDGLICLWIALGYVEARYPTQSLEDAGEEYVLSLMNRGFFHNANKDEFGCITSFGMHDVMHDLAVLVAGSKYKMLDSDSVETGHVLDERVGHVSFWKEMENLPPLLLKNKENVRSLLLHSLHGPSDLQLNGLSRFQHLRAVSLTKTKVEELPQSIGKLIHLRYLDLSRAYSIRKLPNSITQLVNLFYLNLTHCHSLVELPRGISKLVKLRHLHLAGCLRLWHMPSGLGSLTKLQTLDRFVMSEKNSINPKDVGGLDELNCLNSLKGRLELVLRSDFESGWANEKLMSYVTGAAILQEKRKLVSLYINLDCKRSKLVLEGLQPHPNLKHLQIRGYNEERLPSWMMSWGQPPCNSLPNLVEIEFHYFPNCRYVCSFGRLPHLKVLRFYDMTQLEYVENTSTATGSHHPNPSNPVATASAPNPLFPSLETLELSYMPELKGWRKMMCTSSTSWSSSKEESQVLPNCCYYAFPRLKKLKFLNVGLEVVPAEFRDLSTVESLSLNACHQLKEVPEWIDTLTSLKSLEIHDCFELESLPKQMANLTKLEKLEISGCYSLEERCEEPQGKIGPSFNMSLVLSSAGLITMISAKHHLRQ